MTSATRPSVLTSTSDEQLRSRELWGHVRAVRPVKHRAGWRSVREPGTMFLLLIVHRGALWYQTKSGIRHVTRAGDACWLDSSHGVHLGAEPAGCVEFDEVWFEGKDAARLHQELNADREPVFPLRDRRRTRSLLRALQAVVEQRTPASDVRAAGWLTLLLAELVADRADRGISPLSDPVRKALEYISRRYDNHQLTIRLIANEVLLSSVKEFSRRFQREVGLGALAYLNRYRIEQATNALTAGRQSVAQIARSVGFAHPHYFARLFTRIFGVTPLAYRKRPVPTPNLVPRVTAADHRAYLKRRRQYADWKTARSTKGSGREVANYPGPLARALWYYVRGIGHVSHPPGWQHEHHGEDGFVLHIVRRGSLWHEVRGRRLVARVGEACLLDLSQDARYGVEGERPAELSWALLNGKDLPHVFWELQAFENPVFPLCNLRQVCGWMKELQLLTTREQAGYEARSAGLLILILAELFATHSLRQNLLHPARPLSPATRKAIEFIHENSGQRLYLKQLADVAGQSLHYFSRRFHREVGMSPIAYLNRYRIEQATKRSSQAGRLTPVRA